ALKKPTTRVQRAPATEEGQAEERPARFERTGTPVPPSSAPVVRLSRRVEFGAKRQDPTKGKTLLRLRSNHGA
ncbi:MAG: hypothetical protein ACRDYC_10125, partial [Acidimicrobiales bacterium]